MSIKYHASDLVMAVAKNKHFDDSTCRVFLYIISKFMEGPDDHFVWDIELFSKESASEIGITLEEYENVLTTFNNRKIIMNEFTEKGSKRIYLNDESDQWQLNTL